MRWIWIDRFIDFQPGRSATAVKNVSLAEEHLHDHWSAYPVMPFSLMIEGMAQTGGILVGHARDFKEKVILAKITRAEIDDLVLPGDQLQYHAELDEYQRGRGFYRRHDQPRGQTDRPRGPDVQPYRPEPFGQAVPAGKLRVYRAISAASGAVYAGADGMNARRVVITGAGAVTAAGLGLRPLFDALCKGESCIRRIARFDPSGFSCQIGGEIPNFSARDFVPKSYRKAVKVMARDIELAVAAADLAFRDANFKTLGTEGNGQASNGSGGNGAAAAAPPWKCLTTPRASPATSARG